MRTVAFLVFDITRAAGGTEHAVVNTCNALAALPGYRPLILSANSAPGAASGFPLDERVAVEHLGLGEQKNRGIKYPALIRRCGVLVRERGIDVLVGTTHGLNCLLPFIRGGAEKIACEHVNYAACPHPAREARRLLYPRLDAVVLLTELDAARYRFVPESRRFVIPDIAGFPDAGEPDLAAKRMIAVGRLAKEKGFDMLIAAVAAIREEIPGWTVEIFGAGEEEPALTAQIQALGLEETVRIHAPVRDIEREYLRSSIFLLTSRWEGLSMALIEAQSCGLPTVSFNCPEGPRTIVFDGRNGILVKEGDVAAFADAVGRLAASEELRRELGRNAREDARRYTRENVIGLWERLLASDPPGR